MIGCVLPNLTPVTIYGGIMALHFDLVPHNSIYDLANTLIHLHESHYGLWLIPSVMNINDWIAHFLDLWRSIVGFEC